MAKESPTLYKTQYGICPNCEGIQDEIIRKNTEPDIWYCFWCVRRFIYGGPTDPVCGNISKAVIKKFYDTYEEARTEKFCQKIRLPVGH
jgi:hypothetical protein